MPKPKLPAVIDTLYDYRAALDAREISLVETMGKRWLSIESRLNADIAALAEEFTRRQQSGEVITQQMLWRSARYKSLKKQMISELASYNDDAVKMIAGTQSDYAMLGIEAANSAITKTYVNMGRLGSWERINKNAVETMIGFSSDGSPLSELLARDYPDALQGLTDALINGIARGLNPAATALEMTNGMGMGYNRAILIARTETAKAYRMGSTKQYRDSGVVKGFKRLVKQGTACFACLMLDGEVFDLASELDDHPNGKCVAVPLVMGAPEPMWETGRERFEKMNEEEQRSIMGDKRYELLKSGVSLDRFITKVHNDTWGDHPAIVPLSELNKASRAQTVAKVTGENKGADLLADNGQYNDNDFRQAYIESNFTPEEDAAIANALDITKQDGVDIRGIYRNGDLEEGILAYTESEHGIIRLSSSTTAAKIAEAHEKFIIAPSNLQELVLHEMGHGYAEQFTESSIQNAFTYYRRFATGNLSRYAATSPDELIAECYAISRGNITSRDVALANTILGSLIRK